MPLEFAHVSHMSRKSYALTPFLSKVFILHTFIKEEKLQTHFIFRSFSPTSLHLESLYVYKSVPIETRKQFSLQYSWQVKCK